ncbi:hypothetical protein BDP27DRAFT_1424506 [Rhodocollybia butyracea]|uniref:Uncharacterized protein n=1 Tax=Rhodocollybia butyracea TaxID=206335 RepID=A0A9P5PHG5_9AGAR|nr:hypothetical protein BDP27DRAFT_1424506 [Rhodocollybia butyracea]
MAPIRAYYLPADSVPAIDASHPVSIEQINALGWKILSVGGGQDEIEQAGQKIAQELGFPITQEGCIVPFNFDAEKNAAPKMALLVTKVAEVESSDICLANGAVVAITSGNIYIDVEDVTTSSWVRIHCDTGTIYCVPAGAKYRLPFNEQTKGTTGIGFFKETISNHGLLVKKEIDSHPARQAYLKVLGQA